MEGENDEIVFINKTKMDELLKLLEELVVNKIRFEKIKQGIKENEYRKVLDQEIQIVSKVQEIVKKIQTSEMKNVFKKLLEDFKQNTESSIKYHFSGEDAEFENNLETPILNLIKAVLEIYEKFNNHYISISAFNNSSSMIIEITNKENLTDETEQKNLYKTEHIALNYISDDELAAWLNNTSLSELLDSLQGIKSASKQINTSIDLECEKGIFEKTTLTIPYSSSITQAQFVKLANQIFAIPVEYIDKIININAVETKRSNGRELIKYTDRIIPVIFLNKELDMVVQEDFVSYVVLEYNGQMKALPVNYIFEQADIVVRPKPQAISEISEIKGMAILDDGNVTIVIDVPSLFQN